MLTKPLPQNEAENRSDHRKLQYLKRTITDSETTDGVKAFPYNFAYITIY